MIFKQMKKKIWKTGVDLQSMAELDKIWCMQRQFCLVKSIIRREKICVQLSYSVDRLRQGQG